MSHAPSPLVGLFVGGRSSRMGKPKGRIRGADGERLLARLARAAAAAGLEAVLVGEASAYEGELPELPRVPDAPGIEGPMGGLLALLERAGDRPAIALACDMPHVDEATIRALAAARSPALVLAARADDSAPFEPFLARYDAARLVPILREAAARGERSLQRVFRVVPTERFVPPCPDALADWDTPEDVVRGGGSFDEGPSAP